MYRFIQHPAHFFCIVVDTFPMIKVLHQFLQRLIIDLFLLFGRQLLIFFTCLGHSEIIGFGVMGDDAFKLQTVN